ncbi:MAG: PH domain-containing protein [Phycisphaerales bacterium JB040]
MIRIECDNCEKPFEVEDSEAGGKVPCPECGDINRVPAAPSPAAPDTREREPERGSAAPAPREDRATAAGLPPDYGPEQRVVKVRRCWFRSRPLKFSLLVLVLVGCLAGLIYGATQEWPGWTGWLWLLGVAGSALTVGWWWIDRLSASLEITNKRTVMHNGFFSRSTSEVVHDNIRNVQVDQTFWQRVWGVGRLGISSSGQDGIEVSVNHLRRPDELRKMIDLYRPLD